MTKEAYRRWGAAETGRGWTPLITGATLESMAYRCIMIVCLLWGCVVPPPVPQVTGSYDGGGDPFSMDGGGDGGLDADRVERDADPVRRDMTPEPGDGALDGGVGGSDGALDMDAALDPVGADARIFDGSVLDRGLVDEGPMDSAMELADATWGQCLVGGVEGECIDVEGCGPGFRSVPGLCPGPRSIQCCVPVLEGEDCEPEVLHPQELPRPEAMEDGCGAGMVALDTFCIDRYEAALTVDEAGWSPFHNPGELAAVAVSLPGVIPQGYINGHQAAAACAAAGKRLCTDQEWLRACRGPQEWPFPYGPERVPGQCNDARDVHPAVERFPDAPNPFALIQDACINQLPDSVARTGHNQGCVTSEGVYDLMGNLHEWTSAATGTFRGGFYVDTVRNGPGCLYATTAHDRHHWDYSTGFRCCLTRL